jgi:hypothetical protein
VQTLRCVSISALIVNRTSQIISLSFNFFVGEFGTKNIRVALTLQKAKIKKVDSG